MKLGTSCFLQNTQQVFNHQQTRYIGSNFLRNLSMFWQLLEIEKASIDSKSNAVTLCQLTPCSKIKTRKQLCFTLLVIWKSWVRSFPSVTEPNCLSWRWEIMGRNFVGKPVFLEFSTVSLCTVCQTLWFSWQRWLTDLCFIHDISPWADSRSTPCVLVCSKTTVVLWEIIHTNGKC